MSYSQEEIEKLFIGSLIADNNNIVMAMDIVSDGDLVTISAAVSYNSIINMFCQNKPVNLQTFLLEPELKDHFSFLNEAGELGISLNCSRFSEEIAEKARIRRLSARIKNLQNINGSTSLDILDDVKDIYTSEIQHGSESGDIVNALNQLDERIEINKTRGTLGFKTGFDIFDQLDVEYEPGQLWAAGGYTNVGKTSLMIEQILRTGFFPKIAVHSTEMKKYQLIARLLAGMTGISHKLILRGNVKDERLDQARTRLLKSGIRIYDRNRDFDVMWNQCRKDKMQGGLDLVFADYIQNFKRKGQSGYELYSSLGKDSLEIPQELDLTMVMFSQISTAEHKDDSGGVAFKGAGELGESCDIGLWLSKSKTKEYAMLVEFRKNRHGEKKDFLLEFQPGSNRLNEL